MITQQDHDAAMPRAQPDSAVARMISAGQRYQDAMRERIDQRHRDRRVAVIVAVASSLIILVGFAVML